MSDVKPNSIEQEAIKNYEKLQQTEKDILDKLAPLMQDKNFIERLKSDPIAALATEGLSVPKGKNVVLLGPNEELTGTPGGSTIYIRLPSTKIALTEDDLDMVAGGSRRSDILSVAAIGAGAIFCATGFGATIGGPLIAGGVTGLIIGESIE